MRILLIHADDFEYKVRDKAIREAEPAVKIGDGLRIEEALVVFATVEKGDEKDPAEIADRTIGEISEVAKSVQAGNIVIYPYAHLSSKLADAGTAIKILDDISAGLKGDGYRVERSPFGYYKSFTIRCKGHPLSELSRTIELTDRKGIVKAPETKYMVLDVGGELHEPKEYRFGSNEGLVKALVEKEALKMELGGGTPKYLEYCRRFGIEWESYSDLGHMRYGPEAALIFDLIGDYAWQVASSVGIAVYQIRGTNMFDLSVKAVKEHADLFGSRLYGVEVDDRSFVMRYAACHQQFAAVKDWTISYRHLPFATYELADGYRMEQSGELLLCFRTRKLHMPDMHVYCQEIDSAKSLTEKIHVKIYGEIRKLGRDYVSVYNTTRSFFEANRDYFKRLVDIDGKPALLNFVPEGLYYWVINVEHHIIDQLGRPREIATFQIDTGNAERFGISYVDKDGSRRHPPIIHTAMIGTVERYLFTVLDTCAGLESEHKKPALPVWLNPVQVRIIPVTREKVQFAEKILQQLTDEAIRTDIDDRDETIERRVRDAEISWIPYVLVVGAREETSLRFRVRSRFEAEQREMSLTDLVSSIKTATKNYPFRPLTIPVYVSQRPGYVAR